ncbi:MAG: dihydrodipicolinate synthase family protein [Hyphomicrobiaceae bacterium]|nr:MAG: dihydrodipicolinate synthase family protein [Hyphomicrobiaceae bacterium]
MQKTNSLAGIWVAAMTPFAADGKVDNGRLIAYGKRLLDHGVTGLSFFGTTGEGTALSLKERRGVLEAVVKAGIPAAKIIPGTAATDLDTSLEVARHAAGLGCPALLVLPPFFMKGVSQEGVFAHYAGLAEGLKSFAKAPRIMLYNIPDLSGVRIAPATLRRLADAFPTQIVGVKDSSCSLDSAKAYLAAGPDLDILVGDEHLLDFMKANGGAGLLCGMVNVIPEIIVGAWNERDAARRRTLQGKIDAAIAALDGHSIIPAIKAAYASLSGEDGWRATRAPLEAIDAKLAAEIARNIAAAGTGAAVKPKLAKAAV